MKTRSTLVGTLALAGVVATSSVPAFARGAAADPIGEPPPTEPDTPSVPEAPEPPASPDPDAPPEAPPGVEPAPGAPTDPSTNEANKRVGVGVDAFLVIPVGKFAQATGWLGGPVTRFGYRPVLPVEISLRIGYLFAASRDQGGGVATRYDLLPVWLEARWFLTNPFQGFYATVDVGFNLYIPNISPPIPGPAGDEVTKLRSRFGGNVGAGYVVSNNLPIDLRVQWIFPNVLGRDPELKEKLDVGVSISGGYTLQF